MLQLKVNSQAIAREQQFLTYRVDDINVIAVDNEALAHTYKHFVGKQLQFLVKEMQLEGHLVRLAIGKIYVRIVAIGRYERYILCLDTHKFC